MAYLRGSFAFFAALFLFFALTAGGGAQTDEGGVERPRVLAVEFDNDVNPVSADFATDQIDRANEEGYDAVVFLLDTPGGLDSSMREIIKAELASEVPVVMYVNPDGARAASAGVFLMMAADVAAMAPQTNLGSSTPISTSGEEIPEDLRNKVVNDAAKFNRSLAEEHGRNGDWAEEAVREASNLTAREALEMNVIDFISPDLVTLLEDIDGFETQPKELVLNTSGATVDEVSMSLWKRVLDTIIDPNIIVILMSLGLLGIVIELYNPGLIFPGTLGAISLILGLFGLQVLPVNWAGVLLLLLAMAFFVAEVFVTTGGALALAGAASFVFGALLLFDPAGDAFQVSLPVALVIAGTLFLFVVVGMGKVMQARKAPPRTGQDELIGQVAVVRERIDPVGVVFLMGETWQARAEEPIEIGETVRVERVEDLCLEVRREKDAVALV